MGVLGWLKTLFVPTAVEPRRSARPAMESTATLPAPVAPSDRADDAPLPQRRATQVSAASLMAPRIGPLDHEEHVVAKLAGAEQELLRRLSERIQNGDFDLPTLPPTSLAALDLANRASVDVRQLVEAIERDPLITSELLRMANSALYATQNQASSLNQAVMRIGIKSVRNVVFRAAMKSSLGSAKRLNEYAEEVWRQAQSVAAVARAIGAQAGVEREQAYLIGLLHDLGKIALLGMLQREMKDLGQLTPALIGRSFHTFHERAGRAMALAWKLPEEIVSVAGAHHDYARNADHPREAALAKLAHEVDLRLSLRDEVGLRALVQSPLLDALQIREELARWRVLEAARKQWEAHAESNPDA
jgi:HD-like signal output (HDOD) protein